MDVPHWSEILENIVVSFAAVVGGLWAVYRFIGERQSETALILQVRSIRRKHLGGYDVFVDVTLTNVGKSKIQATESRPAYRDPSEVIQYACALEVRAIQGTDALVDYYKGTVAVPDLGQIDLAAAFENPSGTARKTEFWMEPGETVKLGASLHLPSGRYLMKVSFIGSRPDQDFWTQIRPLTLA